MDVCYLINHLEGDGAQRLILKIIRNTDEDIQFTTCAIEDHNPLAPAFRRAGSKVVKFDATSKSDVTAMRRILEFYRTENFDILHAHLPFSQFIARVVSKIDGVQNVVSTQHNVSANYHPTERILERITRPIDVATIAVSNGVRESFVDESSALESAYVDWNTIHNGIDVTKFNQNVTEVDETEARERWGVDEDELLFLNVSRYVPAKAQADAVRAMIEVERAIPEARLFVVGGGQLEGQLKQTVEDLSLENQVNITGRVSDQSIRELYSIADVFVLPSVYEGFGMVLVEAMASELPIVATDIPGVNEVVTEETGFLVPPRSPEDLAKRMVQMQSRDFRRRFGTSGYHRAKERFDIDRVVEAHVDLYRNVLNAGDGAKNGPSAADNSAS